MTREMQCKATTVAGTRCRAPSNVVDPKTILCPAHAPGGREMLREAGKKGGEAMARRFERIGLSAEDLGSLGSVEDVRRWLERIGQAVASGQLDHKAAAGALKAAEIATKMLQTASREEIADMRSELQRVRKVRVVR